MAEHSNENPRRNISFTLNPTDGIKLKQSITALCDSEFNPQGVGLVDITEEGFEITVLNAQTNAVGSLFLPSTNNEIDFRCSYPIADKMINLYQISQILQAASDDDTITVFHLDESTNLSFIFGRAPTEELKVEFLEIDAEFEKLPDMYICCETGLESEILRVMIEQLTKKGELVSMNISEKLVTIVVPQEDSWSFKIKEDDENFEATILTDAQEYHALFELKHLEAMKKASTIAPRFHLRFLDEPVGSIMIRFNLEELGDLMFVYKMILIGKNPINCDLRFSFD